MTVVAAFNKRTGEIKTKGYKKAPGPTAIYNMSKSVMTDEDRFNDLVLIEIASDIRDFDKYVPFKL